ncbi:hypothetical protein [Streptomyces sp. NPDC056670]
MRAADGTAARPHPGRIPLCTDRCVDLLRVSSALCTDMGSAPSRG